MPIRHFVPATSATAVRMRTLASLRRGAPVDQEESLKRYKLSLCLWKDVLRVGNVLCLVSLFIRALRILCVLV